MSTVKWTKEIDEWIKGRIPIREHGYSLIQQMLDELNATFHTHFSITAFKTNCYSKGLKQEHPDAYLKEIAQKFGCCPAAVLRRLRKLGITRKKRVLFTRNKTPKK